MADRDLALEEIRGRVFVIWDVDRERGWLLRGDTVALHLLRLFIQRKYTTEQFDFSSLQILKDAKDDVSPAYRVLDWLNNQETSLNRVLEVHPDTEDKEENKKETKKETKKENKKENSKEEQLKTSLGPKLDRMYAHLLNMSMESPKLNRHEENPSGTLRTWFKKKWGTTLRGWDFRSIAYLHEPTTYDWKMDKDPGWLEMTKELGATFLFAKGMGELLDPVPESSCCHFPTLPAGKSFLASNMETLSALIEKYGGDDDMGDPPDKTVARLSKHQGWEKGLGPFEREGCKGQHDHLGTLGPYCFPVQSLQNAKYQVKFQKRAAGTETELIQQKKLYTKREIQLMMSKHPKGVVVFGHQPEAEELKAMCRRRPTGATQHAAPASAHPAEKSSSQGSTQVSAKTTPGAVSTAGPGRSSTESARRAPSIDSNRSAASNIQARASGATNASAHPRGSTPKSSAASVRTAASSASLRSIGSNSHLKALQGNSSGTGKAQSKGSQPLNNSLNNASLKSVTSATHPRTSHDISHGASQPQASPATPVQKAASNASLRSNASSTHIKAFEGNSTRAAQPQVSASGSAENLMHRAVSSASLRSNNSAARIMDPNAGFCRPNEPSSQQSAPNPNRQPSSSSVRTTSSVASRASGDSQTQRSSSQPPDMGLRKTNTNSSQRSTGSHSSRARENLAAFASNRQRQQPLEQVGNAATAAANLPPGQPANPNQLMSSAGTAGNRSAASGTSPAPRGA